MISLQLQSSRVPVRQQELRIIISNIEYIREFKKTTKYARRTKKGILKVGAQQQQQKKYSRA